jgi:ABC-2 type transport system permease protein
MKAFLNKYAWIAATAARSNIYYFGEAAGRVVFLGVIMYIFLRLWQVTFAEMDATRLGGLTLQQMLWYLAVTEAIMLSVPRTAPQVDQDVRTGQVAMQLIRPLSYPLYQLSVNLGERVVRFTLNLLVGMLLCGIFVGVSPLSAAGVLMLLIALPLAFVLDFLGNFLVGLCAFWIEDTAGIALIYSRLTMILGGMLIPIELFPEVVQPILRALPFASVVYGPARMLVAPSMDELLRILALQASGVLVFSLLVAFVFSKAIRRVQAHGG